MTSWRPGISSEIGDEVDPQSTLIKSVTEAIWSLVNLTVFLALVTGMPNG